MLWYIISITTCKWGFKISPKKFFFKRKGATLLMYGLSLLPELLFFFQNWADTVNLNCWGNLEHVHFRFIFSIQKDKCLLSWPNVIRYWSKYWGNVHCWYPQVTVFGHVSKNVCIKFWAFHILKMTCDFKRAQSCVDILKDRVVPIWIFIASTAIMLYISQVVMIKVKEERPKSPRCWNRQYGSNS